MSTTTSSTLTTAARENVVVGPSYLDGLPGRLGPGNSTIRWGGGLQAHPEVQENDEDPSSEAKDLPELPPPPRTIIPSLATLDKAVSARIYFENLYFPLFLFSSLSARPVPRTKKTSNGERHDGHAAQSGTEGEPTRSLETERDRLSPGTQAKSGRQCLRQAQDNWPWSGLALLPLFARAKLRPNSRCIWSRLLGKRAGNRWAIRHEAGDSFCPTFTVPISRDDNGL